MKRRPAVLAYGKVVSIIISHCPQIAPTTRALVTELPDIQIFIQIGRLQRHATNIKSSESHLNLSPLYLYFKRSLLPLSPPLVIHFGYYLPLSWAIDTFTDVPYLDHSLATLIDQRVPKLC